MKRILPWCVLLLVWLGACSPKVTVQQLPGVNFAKYRTFAWAETTVKTEGDPNPLLRNPMAEASIQHAIESELSKRGVRRTDRNPDFFLTSHIYVEKAERTVANPQPIGFGYPYLVRWRGGFIPVNYGYWYSPAHFQTYRTETYREGTLVIDIIDAKTKNLVWRGSIVDPVNDPARIGQQFAEAARDIIEKFPDGNNVTKS